MPHLYLPSDHSDADLVLAADVAAAVSSSDLYVAWTHQAGPGVTPEVEAVVREQRPPANRFAERLASVKAGVAALWQQFISVPEPRSASTAPPGAPRRTTGEPSL